MGTTLYCQSCGMPIDHPEMRGTEQNGSKSLEYCVYCYADGHLINPDMTLGQMTDLVRTKLKEMNMPPSFIDGAVTNLPQLRRWTRKPTP
ncbi:zinc ribbon domain-containing protein [Puia sp. P3]|uniref:zinc ribbon domain-containing protein n=1 Tax=Puia sp. P3 TaxID=3423952 RepID=UPI003D668A5C